MEVMDLAEDLGVNDLVFLVKKDEIELGSLLHSLLYLGGVIIQSNEPNLISVGLGI